MMSFLSKILKDIQVQIMDVELEHSRRENLLQFLTFAGFALFAIGIICTGTADITNLQ